MSAHPSAGRGGFTLVVLYPIGTSGGAGFSLDALLDGEAAAQRDAAREAAAVSSGVPLTLVRVGRITNAAGGSVRLLISQVQCWGCVCRNEGSGLVSQVQWCLLLLIWHPESRSDQ